MTRRAFTFDVHADDYVIPPTVRDGMLSPALLVYPEHAAHNIDTVLALAGGDTARWRPHLKTTKLPPIWSLLLDRGVRRVKCATTREAAVFLDLARERGVTTDLLIAYPLIGPAIRRAAVLAREHPDQRLSMLIERPEDVHEIPDELELFVDVDSGMRRTGIPLEEHDAITQTARAAGRRFRGLHCYEGHLRHIDFAERAELARMLFRKIIDVVAATERAGLPVRELVTTGTPTFPDALEFDEFRALAADHQVSPGTVVFHDLSTAERLPELALRPAAVVLTRVVSRQSQEFATCDAGSKAISVDAGHPCALVIGHPDLVPQVPTEEHLPLRAQRGAPPEPGEPLLLVPRHVCPTVNLADEAVLIRGHEATVTPVRARGHELEPSAGC